MGICGHFWNGPPFGEPILPPRAPGLPRSNPVIFWNRMQPALAASGPRWTVLCSKLVDFPPIRDMVPVASAALGRTASFEPPTSKTMKISISRLAATALLAAFFTTSAHAGVKFVNHGRAGFVTTTKEKPQRTKQYMPRETTVALVIEKPRQPKAKLQPAGRSGYRYVNTQKRGY